MDGTGNISDCLVVFSRELPALPAGWLGGVEEDSELADLFHTSFFFRKLLSCVGICHDGGTDALPTADDLKNILIILG